VNRPVTILDATLREGEQTPGVCFGAHIKAAAADLLDAVGVDIIEAGHPVVTPEIRAAVGEIAETVLEQVKSIGQTGRIVDLEELALIVGWLDRRARVPAAGGLS
jgi:isopropylmalate/homocitrate/citramalate synthase